MKIPFEKMHGAGNDFVIVWQKDLPKSLDIKNFAKTVCHRQFGIGADQLLVVAINQPNPVHLLIYNADGSEAEMCGNGIRCVARLLKSRELISADQLEIQTTAGLQQVVWQDGQECVKMPPPIFRSIDSPIDLTLGVDDKSFLATMVSMGNPHCVIFTDSKVQARIDEIGPKIENHPGFSERVNVMLARALDQHTIDVAHWERGSGPTLACGSGACAVAAAAIKQGLASSPITIRMRGGELTVDWSAALGQPMWMRGPVARIFTGTYYFEGGRP